MHEGFSLPEVWISWDSETSETESNIVASANPIDLEPVLLNRPDTELPEIPAGSSPITQVEGPTLRQH